MKEKTIKIQGLKTFYREKGKGHIILLLHGWSSSSASWIKTIDVLSQNGFRVVALDLPGFAKTQEPAHSWTISDYSKFVHSFTQAIKLNKFTLMGHSFGGRIGIDYSVRYPEQLNNLILVAAAGIKRYKIVKIKIFLIFTKIGNWILSRPGLKYTKPFISRVWYTISGGQDYRRVSPIMRGVMRRILEENLRAFLPRITMPTLILWGEKDTTTPLEDAEILNEEIVNSFLHIFPEQEHLLHRTIPEELANRIIEFFKAKK